jgi:predicted HicB family RNase H-like nuclease
MITKEYKGFTGKYDFTGNGCYGKLTGIKDLVTFESDTPSGAQKEFENAVDDYLELCNEVGK